jgi:hypothetical protein
MYTYKLPNTHEEQDLERKTTNLSPKFLFLEKQRSLVTFFFLFMCMCALSICSTTAVSPQMNRVYWCSITSIHVVNKTTASNESCS